MPNGDLISRSAALAAMKKAARGVGFNPFKVLNELPAVEAYTKKEIEAAVNDRNAFCATVECDFCVYRGLGCSLVTAKRVDGLVRTYRKRKEETQ